MSEPIDLDLVELRAKVRGWRCARSDDYAVVEGPEPDGCHWRTVVFTRPAFDPDDWRYPILTAPRWTLERLLSEPPEGWDVVAGREALFFQWGFHRGTHRDVSVHVERATGRVSGESISPSIQGRDRAAAHLAAAELALILAEVEP